jgi:hypothetical protein
VNTFGARAVLLVFHCGDGSDSGKPNNCLNKIVFIINYLRFLAEWAALRPQSATSNAGRGEFAEELQWEQAERQLEGKERTKKV